MDLEPNYITDLTPHRQSKKAIVFYVLVVLLSIAIIISTILISYRYFYGPAGSDDYVASGYGNGRSELLNQNSEIPEEIVPQNSLSIGGSTVDGYETQNTISNTVTSNGMNLAVVQNYTVPEQQAPIIEQNTVVDNSNNTNTVVPEQVVTEEKELPKHDFDKNLAALLPKYDETTQSKVRGIYSSDEKQIFLTFDDGPSKVTEQILDILEKYNVKATFFVLGSNVDLNPEIAKRAYQEGHYIANHGYTHKYSSIYADPRNVLAEYEKTEAAIQNAIGVKNYNSYLFRFPGGSSGGYYATVKAKARELLDNSNVAYTNWNCLTGDSEGENTVQKQLDRLYESAGDSASLVVLMHDAGDKKVTVEALPKIIEHYQSLGYEFKTYYDIMK